MSEEARTNNKWSALAVLLTISAPISASAQQLPATATTNANGLNFTVGSETFTLGSGGVMTAPNDGIAQPFDGNRMNMVDTVYGLTWSCSPGEALTVEGNGTITCSGALPTNCPAGAIPISNGNGTWHCDPPSPPPPE